MTLEVAKVDDIDTQHAGAVREVLGMELATVTRIGGGRNSRVYRVLGAGINAVAKFYFGTTADGRDRLQTEYSAFSFLRKQNIRCVPEPLVSDPTRRFAIYSFIDGAEIQITSVSRGDIKHLVDFARQLKTVSQNTESHAIGPAAEACHSISSTVSSIKERYDRLADIDISGPSYRELRLFLKHEFEPVLAEVDEASRRLSGPHYADELPAERRTLSPSDFGFHNALRRGDGQLVFLDFEYFGWDDPAKMLADALLHPKMDLSDDLRSHMTELFQEVFGKDEDWRWRVAALYPLFGLKWCLILLNEFHAEQLQRRCFVDQEREDSYGIQMRQLTAARRLLARVAHERGDFPFWGRDADERRS